MAFKDRPFFLPEAVADTPFAWVLYDGACGFCSRSVPFWEGTLRKRGFGIASLQEPWVAERLGVNPEALLDDFRILVAATAEVIEGADAYRFAMRRIWWAWPLWLLSVTPGLRRLFDRGYRTFAVNRYRISRACRLDDRPESPGSSKPSGK